MQKPRLIYYNDAHHFHGKRIEPPASIHMLQWPVDEVAGTGVDLLVLGLGYGDVYFHNSKVGRVIGQKKEVWENYIDWRIMRMVEEAAILDTDQVREGTRRGRELGLKVFPSLTARWRDGGRDEQGGLAGIPGRNTHRVQSVEDALRQVHFFRRGPGKPAVLRPLRYRPAPGGIEYYVVG